MVDWLIYRSLCYIYIYIYILTSQYFVGLGTGIFHGACGFEQQTLG